MRHEPQLLKAGELEYIIQTAQAGNECRLIEHIQAMYKERDGLVSALQSARLTIVAESGYRNPVVKLARIRMIVDRALKGEW